MENVTGLILSLSSFLLVMALYGRFVESRWLRVKTLTVHSPEFHRVLGGRKVVHISDLHLNDPWSPIARKTLSLLQNLDPDIVCITGDFIRWYGSKKSWTSVTDYIGRMKASLGIYAVLGDADYSAMGSVDQLIRGSKDLLKFNLLRNQWRQIDTENGTFIVAGFDYASDIPAEQFLESLPPMVPTILLGHVSLIFDKVSKKDSVMVLSGDSHGGQVYLPSFLWHMTQRKPDPRHLYGLFTEGNKALYVTSGIGTSRPHIRIGRPPEVVVIQFAP